MKGLGKEFQEKFINSRVTSGEEFSLDVGCFLNKNKIEFELYLGGDAEWEVKKFNLIEQFFGEDYGVLHINPKKSDTCLIGKGVVIDTGGYNVKPNMKEMFFDKNGAILAVASALEYDMPALVFFTPNFIRNETVQGMIMHESISGLNVLIDDTDAEGRIGLANLISYAKSKEYKNIITLATLTGSAHNFSGDRTYALVHSTEKKILENLVKDVFKNKLDLWPAPGHKQYDKAIDTKIIGADVRSCGSFKGAGSSTAFSFLKRFSTDMKHIHVDMASMLTDKDGNGYIWGIKEVGYLLGVIK